MNEALLDATLLIAAHDESHVDHARARAFVDQLQTFHTTPQTQGAFLRFFTRPWKNRDGIPQLPRMTTGQALETLKQITALKEHRFTPDSLAFTEISMRSLSGFKQWNDAYLIALARNGGLKLATLERKLDNMDNPKTPILHKVP